MERGSTSPRPASDRDEVRVLFARLRADADPSARDELVNKFMPLARKLASRYTNPYEPFDDLVQVASIGLLGAIDRFDPERGVSFTSFAVPTILGELKRYFRRTGWSAHVPRRAQELALQVDKGAREIAARTGGAPDVAELAAYLELTTEEVLTGLDAGAAHYAVSLDAPAPAVSADSEPEPLVNRIAANEEGFALTETTASLSSAMTQLPRLEAAALRLRLTEDLKQTEIADRLGCSQMQVSRLLRRAAEHIREVTGGPPA